MLLLLSSEFKPKVSSNLLLLTFISNLRLKLNFPEMSCYVVCMS